MDPVNSKALKGKFKDRADKDIDNDGDVDSSDEYLHKRRKAVSKAIGKIKESAETKDGDGVNIVRDRKFKGKPSKTIPHAKPGEPGYNTHASMFKKDGPKPAWMDRAAKMKKEEVELDEAEMSLYDKIKAARANPLPDKPVRGRGSKNRNPKTYDRHTALDKEDDRIQATIKRRLKKEEVEQIDEIQINWSHKTQKYHTIKHPDGSHWGVFDHRSYGTKGHEIRKIRDSEGNAIKASDSRRNHSSGYKSGMGSPSEAAKEWAKKHGGTITNHKIKEEKE